MIIIDPGHGGKEPNNFRVAPNGVREAELNLEVALYLKKLLEKEKIPFKLTREADVAVELKDRIKDLKQDDLFISIHHNSYDPPETKSSFPIVYVSQNHSDLGVSLLACFEKYHPRKGSCIDSKAVFDSGIYVLENSVCPSVLGEFDFFSSNSHERKNFIEDEAKAYLEFIKNHLNGSHQTPSNVSLNDIKNIRACYEGSQPPVWLTLLDQWDELIFTSLTRQEKLCPLIGRLYKGIPFYFA